MTQHDEPGVATPPGRMSTSVYGRLGSLTREARARLKDQPTRAWIEVPFDSADDVDAATQPGARTVPDAIKEAAAWSWRLLLIGVLGYVIIRALALVPIVTVPFVVALLLTAVLGPVQRWLRDSCRIPHSLAAFLALLVGIAVIGGIGTFVGAQISTNAPRMAERLGESVTALTTWVQQGPLQISDAQVAQYGEELRSAITRNQETLLSGALSTLSALSHVVAGGLLLVLSTFFLLRDGELIWRWALSLLPRHSRARLDRVGRFGWRTLGGFMRGQTIIAFLHASTVFVVLVLLHVPMAVALAVLIFVGSYIPILGMTVTGTFCVVVTLIEHGPGAAVAVAVTILVLIQAEAHLLQPLIMARTVEVHPLGVAVAVLAGTALGGIAGALFAVPIVAFLNATVRALHLAPDAREFVGIRAGSRRHPVDEPAMDPQPVDHG